MSNITQNIKSFKVIYPQVYSYILPNRQQTNGSQKIGYTEKINVDERILQQVKTAAFTEAYTKLWSASAFFEGNEESFTDKAFHRFLEKKGIERKIELGREWFYFNGEPFKSKDLFDLFRKEKFHALQNNNGKVQYTLRFEQNQAIIKAQEYFEKNENGEFLWNAKPRFGKTLASYDLAKRLKANKVLIVTNRPSVANSWFDDFEMFVDGYTFISETSSLKNKATLTREQYISIKPIKPLITFLSLQDLKGSKFFGGNFDKLRWIADLEWDLLVIDEAHEGIDTGRTDAAFDVIKRKNTLHLSGTPFKALANEKFPKDAIYNWTYLDEQKIKQIEIEEGEIGEHTDLPELKLFTYRISQMITDEVNEGIEIDNETRDYAFDLNEFFRAKDKKFIHENEITEFLKNLTANKKYPFSTPELREELKHTFWYVGNRVESVKALEQLLKKDSVFKDYTIIVAAGDGRSFEEEENDFKGNESSFQKVKKAIAENDKTITLSCGQLTTGVTIKEWTAVLMLTDIKAPSLYMQAAFRAQNPYKEFRNGELLLKKSAYLFDFAPTRVLEIYDQFANGLNPKAVKGEITEKDREENIKELLNFFPVISEDVNGEMIELDAQKVLTFPNALAASEIVNARFMTNLLFNDSLKGVFNFPKEVEDILDKMQVEKNKRVNKAKNTLDLDDARTINNNKLKEINQNKDIILGEKIFKSNTERVVDNLLGQNSEQIYADELFEKVVQVAEPLIAKYKEVYKATQAETNEVTKQIQEKVKQIAEEFNNAEIKDSLALKQKLIDTIEVDFVNNKVAQKEEEKIEKVQKTKEEEIRDRLRSFTRTIPMFIMANEGKDEITIDNFDTEIDDKDFEELTSITKEEFHKLRDGFDYDEDGERKFFQGVFNKYRFNASIAEFKLKKDQLANYFTDEEDIFQLIPNQKTNQIFTPKQLVQIMINKLEEHDPSLFTRTDSTFIDLYMKSGMYITEIVKKLYTNTRKLHDSDEECLKHILENQVYGLAPTPILQGITQSYIFGFDSENIISRENFIQHDISPEAQKAIAKEKVQKLFNLKEDMKFDAVVGNPPYQESIDGYNRQEPIYQYFYDSAESISEKYCLISPARFLFNAGLTKKDWNLKMLNHPHISVVYYNPNSNELFQNTDIKGGVAAILFDRNKIFGAIKKFIPNDDLKKIASHFEDNPGINLPSIMFGGRSDLKFNDEFIKDYPNSAADRLSQIQKKHPEVIELGSNEEYELKSSTLEVLQYAFKNEKPKYLNDYYSILGLINGKRVWQWIEKKYMQPRYPNNNNIDKYKVFVPKANGSGAFGEMLSTPAIGKPSESATSTFISIGSFDTEIEAANSLKYLKTKLLRCLLSVLKITQDNPPLKWSLIPIQDFSNNSDIDWSKSIADIDQQLYMKYQLSPEEIIFIEENVQTMN
ncbi:Eco57I restriction-modification methylase domain-containing protein [Chryseobacterium balustinum]|uniref:Eco57I restriction-modification methylase domain-containing protein n=1 Tax=Chryseobacterium balustinum TaxID=246 RepID=UPI003CEB94B7